MGKPFRAILAVTGAVVSLNHLYGVFAGGWVVVSPFPNLVRPAAVFRNGSRAVRRQSQVLGDPALGFQAVGFIPAVLMTVEIDPAIDLPGPATGGTVPAVAGRRAEVEPLRSPSRDGRYPRDSAAAWASDKVNALCVFVGMGYPFVF